MAADAGYDAQEIYNIFSALLYSYLPIDEIPFTNKHLEKEHFKIDEDLISDDIKSISAEEDVDDEFHTHPNIRKRRLNVSELRNELNDENGKTYLVESS